MQRYIAEEIATVLQGGFYVIPRFQTPFASPPGVGESSPVVNVLWGFLNLAVGFALLFEFAPKGADVVFEWVCFGLGALVMALFCAWHFGRVRSRRG